MKRVFVLVMALLLIGSPAAAAAAPVEFRFTFDKGVADSSGSITLSVRSAYGGRLGTVRHGSGLAVRYPPRCGGDTCPRAILESGPASALNPRTGTFTYGASVRVRSTEVKNGANVVQKGFAGPGSQFKLQVDRGKPSCVVVGAGTRTIYRAAWRGTIADAAWHALGCRREQQRLVLTVDGTQRASIAVPASLTIANESPLRIGGKNVSTNNDQFVGEIDDVYVRLG